MAFLTRTLSAAALMAAFCAAPAWAQQSQTPPTKTPTPQQQRMADCNKSAGDRKGDERKGYMSSCLKGDISPNSSQQQRMTDCNAKASAQSLMGDKRKAFMKDCLSNKS